MLMLTATKLSALAAAIRRTIPDMEARLCEDYAARLIRETDGRLEENVLQWISGAPLTDIWICGYCVGLVMQIQGRQDFLGALEALNCYIANPISGEKRIWRTLR